MNIFQAARIAAAAMLLLALLEMPDEYYKALRFVVVAAAFMEIYQLQRGDLTQGKKTAWTLALAGVAIIFNPLLPLEMERETWVWFDVSGSLLFASLAILPRWKRQAAWAAIVLISLAALPSTVVVISKEIFKKIEDDKWAKRLSLQIQAPDGLIDDATAWDYFEKIDTATEEERSRMAGKLEVYFDAQEKRKAAETESHFERLYTDPAYFDRQAQNPVLAAAAKQSLFPKTTLVIAANQAFIANYAGIEAGEVGPAYEALRDAYAQANFNKPSVTDEEFFRLVGEQFKAKRLAAESAAPLSRVPKAFAKDE